MNDTTSKAPAPTAPPTPGRRRLRLAIELLVVVALVVGFRAYQQRDAASGPAPAFEAPRLDGGVASLEDHRGRPVIVHFWASWCGVCRAMEGNVESATIAGVPVVRVATRSGPPAEVRAFLASRGATPDGADASAVIVDEDGVVAARYGVRAFPTTFFLDGDGTIRHVEVGYTTSVGLALRALLLDG